MSLAGLKSLTLSTKSSEAVEQRKIDLTKYLNALLKVPTVKKSDEFSAFISPSFADLFQRLKNFAHKCERQEKEIIEKENQRSNAIAQLESFRRRNDEQREKITELEKENNSMKNVVTEKNNNTQVIDITKQLDKLKDTLKTEKEKNLLELKENNNKWEKKNS